MKKLFLLLLLVSSLFAQNGVAPLPNSKPQYFSNSGNICSGCKLYTFSTGTTNQLPTFTDSSGTVQNTNPITMGSDGRPPQEIWLGSSAYDITLKTASNSTIYTLKNIAVSNGQSFTQLTVSGPVIITSPTPGIASSSSILEWDASYSNGTTILTDKFQCSNVNPGGTNPATVLTCNHTGSPGGGSVLFNFPFVTLTSGSTTNPNNFGVSNFVSPTAATAVAINGTNSLSATGLSTLAGGVCYKFSNGQSTIVVSASCGYTTWALALAACPSTGCILDGWAPDVPLVLDGFDTGSNTKPVTVRLGPYNFTATQITVRQGLDLGGAGILNTNITSVGTNAQPLFVNVQGNNNAITVKIHDFSANALAGNTSQDGIFFDCSTITNAGVELSRLDNIILNGFKGSVVHFKATQDGVSGSIGCFQGSTITNVTAIRPTGATGATQNALRVEGGTGQIDFYNDWFDGQSNDTGTNVFVGTTGTQAPYSIHFHGTTNQNGFAYLFDGCNGCTTENDHFEVIKGVYNFATTASPIVGFHATTPYINSNVAVNAGSGYIVNIPGGAPNVDVIVESPLIGGQPDKCIVNATNGTNVQILNAQYVPGNTPTNVCVTSGVTYLGTPAATLDIRRAHTVQLSASATSITTLKSDLQPGELVTFYTTGGTAQFATGGNLSLGTQVSPLVVPSGDSATFIRADAGSATFVLVGLSRLIIKHQRFGASCTTGAAVGAACNTTYTWTNAFPDANYTVSCTVNGATSGIPTVINTNSKAGATFNVSIAAFSAVAAQASGVDCLASHDPGN